MSRHLLHPLPDRSVPARRVRAVRAPTGGGSFRAAAGSSSATSCRTKAPTTSPGALIAFDSLAAYEALPGAAQGRSGGARELRRGASEALHPARGAHVRDAGRRNVLHGSAIRCRRRRMIAVIFEALPHPDRKGAYLDAAARCGRNWSRWTASSRSSGSRASPRRARSFRFPSGRTKRPSSAGEMSTPTAASRRKVARRIFADYRLRVAQVLRDYGPNDRAQAPDDSRHVHGG